MKKKQHRDPSPDELTDSQRTFGSFFTLLISALAISFAVFQLYTAIFGVFDALKQRSFHLSFALALIYLLFPYKRNRVTGKWSLIFDIFLALLAAAAPLYLVVNFEQLLLRAGRVTSLDMFIGFFATLFVLEAARRVVGWPMVIIAVSFVLYALLGSRLPGILAHRGFAIDDIIGHLFYTTEGIFGIPLGVSATYIFLFILFSAFLDKTGVGLFFIDLSNSIAGRSAGGPAKVAVLSSGLMGMISGSSVGNVVATGSFTIPMMKKLGYRGEFAGAVEATASTGGQLMPPIMGAAAFLIAEFTGESYTRILGAALLPAILYYLGVWGGVHFEARKLGLRGLTREELPRLKELLLERGHLILPLLAIIFMLITGFTAMKAALLAIVFCILCAMLRPYTRISWKQILEALEQGARSALGVAAATACAGIIIGIVTLTGLGLKLGGSLVELAGGSLFFTLVLTMLTSLLLGMGVPTTANYVITSTIAAPALLLMDSPLPILAVHLFVFYFGIIADITPPVALAAFAASGIARANPLRTGFSAFKLAIAAFLVPYIFAYNPQLLLIDVNFLEILLIFITGMSGILGVSSSVAGFLLLKQSYWERAVCFVAGLLLLMPQKSSDLYGAILLLVIIGWQLWKKKCTRNNYEA